MSLLDALIFGVRRLFINGTEQPLKTGLELRGSGLTVSQLADRNIVDISSTGNTTAHYLVTEADAGLPNNHAPVASSSIAWSWSTGEVSVDCNFGTTPGTVCEGNDARLAHTSTGVAQVAMAAGSPVALVSDGGLMPAAFGLGRVSGILLDGASSAGPTLTYQYFGPSIQIPAAVWFDKPTAADIGKPVYSPLDASFILTLTKPAAGPYQEIGTVLFADAGADTTTIMICLQPEGP